MKKYLYALTLVATFASCKHDPVTSDKTSIIYTLKTDSVCDSSIVYFINDIQPIISSSCAYSGCHDQQTAENGVDLSSYESIIITGEVVAGNPNKSKLYTQISGNQMPPGYPLSAEQKNKIKTWIEQGAEYNQCLSDCDTFSVSFVYDIQSILNNNCVSCHNSNNANGNPPVVLDNYDSVKVVADNGRLLGTITGQLGYASMPPGGSLPECDINKIKNWINNDATNN